MGQLKFFTEKQFTTLVKAIEVLIDTGGNDAISAEESGKLIDAMLAESNSPALDMIPKVFNQLENVVPPLFLIFEKFSNLNKSDRKKIMNKLINNEGLLMNQFRDLARALKVMSCVSYYGSPQGMKQVGFIAFEDRPRSILLDTQPLIHLDN